LIIKILFATEVTETTERFVFKKQKKKVNVLVKFVTPVETGVQRIFKNSK